MPHCSHTWCPGIASLADFAPDGFRLTNPRYTEENFRVGLDLADEVQAGAADAGATPAQVAPAWLLTRSEQLAVIPGTKRAERVEENGAADRVVFDDDRLARLDALAPAAGRRPPLRRGRSLRHQPVGRRSGREGWGVAQPGLTGWLPDPSGGR
ncbi:aldo/keto reductase [Streptomyces tremellae]|uniref:aldo/keto reductase n=1 Tax=Streptomyces tremellae TaxID=1124239 RepID=UPI0031EFF34C